MPRGHPNRLPVTGANSGIGLVTARELARAGARVIMACRDTAKGERVAASVRAEVSQATIQVAPLDLASLESVRAFARGFSDARLDVLIDNAGVMVPPKRTTADGYELQSAPPTC